MSNLPKLQYISDGETLEEQWTNISSALNAGVQWIQLRWKNAEYQQVYQLAEKVKLLCEQYNAILIINDYPEIAQQINATGVHLGLNDIPILQAKKILHPHQWIGGTANTLNDVLQRIQEQVTYIGLGPLRYTTTKKNLSPILGFDGYKKIISALPHSHPPIYAIGGITEKDIPSLLETGVYGIALSSAINKAINKPTYIQQLNQLLYETTKNC